MPLNTLQVRIEDLINDIVTSTITAISFAPDFGQPTLLAQVYPPGNIYLTFLLHCVPVTFSNIQYFKGMFKEC